MSILGSDWTIAKEWNSLLTQKWKEQWVEEKKVQNPLNLKETEAYKLDSKQILHGKLKEINN